MQRFTHACLRAPGPEIVDGLSLHSQKQRPDFHTTLHQHQNYLKALEMAGLKTGVAPADMRFPDGCFVEDTHLVFPHLTVALRPGASSRRDEGASLRDYLPHDRPLIHLVPEGVDPEGLTLDGGDVLVLQTTVFVGLSSRTSEKGFQRLQEILTPSTYKVIPVIVPEGLHLKSGVTCTQEGHFLLLPAFASLEVFTTGQKYFIVPDEESLAANILPLNDVIIIPPECPQTKAYLQRQCPAKRIVEVDTREFAKVDGALTCLSLRW